MSPLRRWTTRADHPDTAARAQHQAFVDLMIPIVKGWSTESAIEVASLGMQIHGGMGYIEETGAAQYLRDARITTIYEGTTGIQANDLVGRKIARESGVTAKAILREIRSLDGRLAEASGEDFVAIRKRLAAAVAATEECVDWIVANFGKDIRAVHAGSVPFLKLMGILGGGWQLARAALAVRAQPGDIDADFGKAKVATARFFADHQLSQAPGLRDTIVAGAPGVLALSEEQF